jgi:hypothetical protein
MNKFLLVLFFSASKILALDLTFELVYESTDIAVGEDLTGKFYGSIINSSSDSISIAVISKEIVLPDGWSTSICLGELCYNESVDSASVYLGTSDSVSLGVLAWANGLGQGVIKLDVFNIAYPDDNIILELHFDTNQLNLINNENYNPQKFKITKAYPNPFNPNIAIDYNLKEDSKLSLNIYNSTGKHVKSLFDEYQSKGYRSIKWNATNDRNDPVSAGLYIFTMQVGKFRQTKKIVLLK